MESLLALISHLNHWSRGGVKLAILDICRLGDPILRQKAEHVPKVSQKIKDLLVDLADTMYAAPGVGLAAPQIGVRKRVIVIDVGEGLLELVNPVCKPNRE